MRNYQPQAHLLKNKVILVTGANSDIGKAVSIEYAKHGATIILLDKNIEALEKTYDQIEKNYGIQPAIYPLDMSGATPKDYEDLAVNLENEFSHLDGIVHNQTLLGSLMPIDQYNLEHWAKVMQVNLHAPYLLSRSCLALLNNSKEASIIFCSDDVGDKGKSYWGAYAISKAGITNLMQIMADEFEANTKIRVNSINPGIIANELRHQAYPGEDPSSLLKPEDIVPAYLYLMGKDSAQVNGQIIQAQ